MSSIAPDFDVRLAASPEEIRAAQRLRYEVFVAELGGDGPLVDHAARLEQDRFDPHYDHMLLLDRARGAGIEAQVVGVYRLMLGARATSGEGFYTAGEYDLGPLLDSGRELLELGRSCLHPDYRGGPAMFHLWNGLAAYTLEREIEVLFGVASFHGTDPAPLVPQLALLGREFLAPPDLRVRALDAHYQQLDLMPGEAFDRGRAMRRIPALIKAYLRLGGFVGDGAFVDHAFNTTDVCLVLDVTRMNARQRAIYTRGLGG